ncbi:hypothetical protein HYH02_015555 [Chlamydomonas schloesseri]|uniref:Uncharacterized protein n=1 Tax=Chlamydomonas schloesseri TaxID=2026947 RepID=A0A835SGD7_9CHLO|nr:hypothetical protein HYH02_015555 [Chlamydomonas schloesseri]|eukprot:KAG2421984.1 hypothetical protein HYH02_015555 [Chlamydomonas schloesseri]
MPATLTPVHRLKCLRQLVLATPVSASSTSAVSGPWVLRADTGATYLRGSPTLRAALPAAAALALASPADTTVQPVAVLARLPGEAGPRCYADAATLRHRKARSEWRLTLRKQLPTELGLVHGDEVELRRSRTEAWSCARHPLEQESERP